MVIYNVTIHIENQCQEDWLKFMKNDHIPKVMASGCFIKYALHRLVNHKSEGANYAVQYFAQNHAVLQQYFSQFSLALQEEHQAKFKDKYVAFRSILETIDEG